ncbi:Hypothetical protein SSCIU_02463 [Mammaliicoccus sciuri]|nr:Hypothetical protein SSCIU_02463 [Mammaliicoccus sciuri]
MDGGDKSIKICEFGESCG